MISLISGSRCSDGLSINIEIKYCPLVQMRFASKQVIFEMLETGRIELIYGPMFSGKSSELLRKIRRYQHAKKRCLVVNYLHDNRYTDADEMATHDQVTRKATKLSTLVSLLEHAQDYDVIGIDEGQFFPDIATVCEELANMGKAVIVAALDGTFERKAFGRIIDLIPLAEKVSKLSAVCVYCCCQAAFTKRIVASQEIELIGGAEMYKPVCRGCFFQQEERESPKRVEVGVKKPVQEFATQKQAPLLMA